MIFVRKKIRAMLCYSCCRALHIVLVPVKMIQKVGYKAPDCIRT